MSAAAKGGDAEATPRQEFERERLFGEAIEVIANLIDDQGISQRKLAQRLKRSDARVSRLLAGGENLTLKTVADLGHAVGVRFALVPIPYEDRTGTPAADDPPPPAWLEKRRQRVAGKARAEAPSFD